MYFSQIPSVFYRTVVVPVVRNHWSSRSTASPPDLPKVAEKEFLLRTGYSKLICYVKEKAEQKLSPY